MDGRVDVEVDRDRGRRLVTRVGAISGERVARGNGGDEVSSRGV